LAWDAAHAAFFAQHGRRQRVFCASLANVFDNAVGQVWRADLFELIEQTPNLDWLLLTKRIGIAASMTRGIRSLSERLYREEFAADLAQAMLGHKNAQMTSKYDDLRGGWKTITAK
jgi:protein gp37